MSARFSPVNSLTRNPAAYSNSRIARSRGNSSCPHLISRRRGPDSPAVLALSFVFRVAPLYLAYPAIWSRNPLISSAESTIGIRFGSFGVGTSRAGFSFKIPSRTQYLKNDRSAASFLAIELFSSPCSCRWPTNSRIIWWFIFATPGAVRPGGDRYVTKLFQIFSVINHCVRRRVPHRPQVFQEIVDRLLQHRSRRTLRHTFPRWHIQACLIPVYCRLAGCGPAAPQMSISRLLQLPALLPRWFALRLRRLLFRRQFLPIASFFDAGIHCADFALLLHDEWCAALRARLGDRHIRRSVVAIGIPRTSVEEPHSSAAALAHACAFHKFAFVALRAFDSHA